MLNVSYIDPGMTVGVGVPDKKSNTKCGTPVAFEELRRWLVGQALVTKISIWIHRTDRESGAAYVYNPSRFTERLEEETADHRPGICSSQKEMVSKNVEGNDQLRLSSDLEMRTMAGKIHTSSTLHTHAKCKTNKKSNGSLRTSFKEGIYALSNIPV